MKNKYIIYANIFLLICSCTKNNGDSAIKISNELQHSFKSDDQTIFNKTVSANEIQKLLKEDSLTLEIVDQIIGLERGTGVDMHKPGVMFVANNEDIYFFEIFISDMQKGAKNADCRIMKISRLDDSFNEVEELWITKENE